MLPRVLRTPILGLSIALLVVGTSALAADNAVQLTFDPDFDVSPAWSPDGSQIAFSSHRTGSTHIWVVPASGGTPTQVTFDLSMEYHAPAWSPDGTQIAVYSGLPDQNIRVIPATGGPATQLTFIGKSISPTWSPDGSQIAFASSQGGASPDIWVVPATGGPPTQLTSGADYDHVPTWSPRDPASD